MDEQELKQCCLPLLEYANEQVQEKGVTMELLKKIREQVIMACTELANDYTIDNQKVAMSEEELNAMRGFYHSKWADEYLNEFNEYKTGEEVVIKFLSDVPRMLGEYDFGDAIQIKQIISGVTNFILQSIQRQ